MEPAAGRVGSLPMPSSQAQRREWRAVSESCVRSNGNEVPEHVKLGQSDERTIYEKVQEGTGPLGVDLCSITIDGGGDELQQRLHSISRQREELQQVEIELRARVFAKTEIVEMQKNFDTQISEHVNAVSKLKEQLHKREQHIHQLEMKMEEKERELRAVKIDKEAAWAKEDRLREQNKELATFRVVRDNLEAERAQHLKQIHELEECLQAKENQYLELEKQHRVAHETTLLKDEQLKEAHAWMAHAQEMDAFHSTTNQALQAELQEHIEQFNQCLIGLHQQVDRHYRQTIQQLQLDLAEAREQNITLNDDSQMACTSSMDPSSYVQNKGNHIANVNVGSKTNGSLDFVVNGDNAASFMSTPAVSAKSVHVPGAPVVSSSILGLSAFLPPGQVITPHPFVMHPQGTQSVAPVSSHVPQTQIGYFQPVPTISSYQHWKNQQAASEIHQIPNQSQQSSQVGENLLKSDAQYSYEISAEQRAVNPDYLESFKSQGQGSETIANGSDGKVQVIDGKELESNVNNYVPQGPRETSREDSHYHYALGMDIRETSSKPEINGGALIAAVNQLHAQVATSEEKSQADIALTVAGHLVNSIGVPECNANVVTVNESSVSAMQTASSLTSRKVPEPNLLDERALLACLVRVIPAVSSGGIRISSTLPNRLGKMLAPLHWHDYRKQYGKLDDFVACHPELFVIEGDFIHLREGAQEMISTTTAFAKVAAAAAASKPYSSMLPSVAVTPVAQPHRVRKDSSAEMKTGKGILCPETAGLVDPGISPSDFPQILSIHNQQQNGVSFNVVHGISDLKIRKSEVPPAQNCSPFGTQSEHVSLHVMAEKEFDLDKTLSSSSQSKGSSTGRHGVGGKQQRSQGLRHRGSC